MDTTITVRVPDSIRQLMREAPDRPPGAITSVDIQQYVAGLLIAAVSLMGPTGQGVALELRVLNEDDPF